MRVDLKNNGRLASYAAEIMELSRTAPAQMAKSLNVIGARIRARTILAEARQTGLSPGVIRKAQKEHRADAANLTYGISAAGGNISLRYFKPKETRPGVIARPKGIERMSPGAFMRGGHFPHRVKLALGGNVFIRSGAGRSPLKLLRSDVYLADELVTGTTAATFEAGADQAVGVVMRDLAKLLG